MFYRNREEPLQDLKFERLETPAESSTTKTEKSPNEDSPEEAENLEAERIVKPTK